MTAQVETWTASNGTELEFLHHDHGSDDLVVWFSAFTRGPILGRIMKVSPRFHGFRLSGTATRHNWLLMRDSAGLTGDGTYYGGSAGNLFMEEAVREKVTQMITMHREAHPQGKIIAMGSSMGGYAAMKFGLLCGFDGVFIYSPHLDLKIAMEHCGRGPWIRHCLSGDAELDSAYLSRLQRVVDGHSETQLPPLILQTSIDDSYVYPEQVAPFIETYSRMGGVVTLDLRDSGGHGSMNAQDAYILAAVASLVENSTLDLEGLRKLPPRPFTRQEKIERVLHHAEAFAARLLRRGFRASKTSEPGREARP
ncbi:MAG: lysophospholipase [Actinomycetia bacterium]|nr:lysophospholipase [Actinomycetes bacterium]